MPLLGCYMSFWDILITILLGQRKKSRYKIAAWVSSHVESLVHFIHLSGWLEIIRGFRKEKKITNEKTKWVLCVVIFLLLASFPSLLWLSIYYCLRLLLLLLLYMLFFLLLLLLLLLLLYFLFIIFFKGSIGVSMTLYFFDVTTILVLWKHDTFAYNQRGTFIQLLLKS